LQGAPRILVSSKLRFFTQKGVITPCYNRQPLRIMSTWQDVSGGNMIRSRSHPVLSANLSHTRTYRGMPSLLFEIHVVSAGVADYLLYVLLILLYYTERYTTPWIDTGTGDPVQVRRGRIKLDKAVVAPSSCYRRAREISANAAVDLPEDIIPIKSNPFSCINSTWCASHRIASLLYAHPGW
jgi:hypothetical protein